MKYVLESIQDGGDFVQIVPLDAKNRRVSSPIRDSDLTFDERIKLYFLPGVGLVLESSNKGIPLVGNEKKVPSVEDDDGKKKGSDSDKARPPDEPII